MACLSQGVPWGQSVRAGEAAGAQSPGTRWLNAFGADPGLAAVEAVQERLAAGSWVPALLHAVGAGPALKGVSYSGLWFSKGLRRRSGAWSDRDQP